MEGWGAQIFGDMGDTVIYLSKSFSLREDDSRAPHFSLTLCQYNIRPFGLGGFRVASFSLFDLEPFRDQFLYSSKNKKTDKNKKKEEGFFIFRRRTHPIESQTFVF